MIETRRRQQAALHEAVDALLRVQKAIPRDGRVADLPDDVLSAALANQEVA